MRVKPSILYKRNNCYFVPGLCRALCFLVGSVALVQGRIGRSEGPVASRGPAAYSCAANEPPPAGRSARQEATAMAMSDIQRIAQGIPLGPRILTRLNHASVVSQLTSAGAPGNSFFTLGPEGGNAQHL